MAGPFQISTVRPGAWSAHTPPAGPYEFDGALYVLAFNTYPMLGVWKSIDDGASWNQVGSEVELSTEGFGACLDADFPTNPYVYVAYSDPARDIRVIFFDLDAQDFGAPSTPGPTIAVGIDNIASLLIAPNTAGEFGLMHIIEDADINGVRRTSISLLDSSLSSWDGPTNVSTNGTDADDTMVPVGIARGTDGRIHGFVVEYLNTGSAGESVTIYHTLVRQSGGGIGGSIDLIEADGDVQGSAAEFGSRIAVEYSHPLGNRVAIAESANVPSWSISTSGEGHHVLFAGAGDFENFYKPADDILRSTFNGSTWNTPDTAASSLPFVFMFSGRAITDASALLYYDLSDYWFVSVAPGGGGLILTGETIPSGEDFKRTHGITGGGGEQNCGPATIVPFEPGCNGTPFTPVDPGDRNTCDIAVGFSA